MKHNFIIMAGIIVISLLGVLAIGWESGALYEIPKRLQDVTIGSATPGHGYVMRAVSLLKTGTFNNGEPGYFGITLRSPGYSFVLAAVIWLFGEYIWPIYLINYIFYVLAIIFLWRISTRYFAGLWQFLPPLMLALFWGASSKIWIASYEPFILFLSGSCIVSYLKYRDTGKVFWFMAGTLAFAAWVVEKPALLYTTPFVLAFLVCWQWRNLSRIQHVWRAILFAFLLVIVVGSWSLRNHRVLGTWQLASGGHSILRSSSHVDFTRQQLISLALSLSLGDYIGSRVYAHYPANAEPIAWDPKIDERWYPPTWILHDLDGEALTRAEMDRKMYREAIANIQRRPVKFLLTSVIGFVRLNAPVNHRGQEIMRMFMGKHESFSVGTKIAIILAIRLLWLLFLVVTFAAAAVHWKEWKTWGILLFFILYYNGIHAIFSHAEVRYILTALPLYFIFFTEGARMIQQKYARGA